MKTIDQKVYDDWKAQQKDDYSREIFNYAERWADLMEAELAKKRLLKTVADKASHDADTTGITGFMYGAAVSVLSQCWTHGEELRQWHNLKTQIGKEGEAANRKGGVLNPAILNIAK